MIQNILKMERSQQTSPRRTRSMAKQETIAEMRAENEARRQRSIRWREEADRKYNDMVARTKKLIAELEAENRLMEKLDRAM